MRGAIVNATLGTGPARDPGLCFPRSAAGQQARRSVSHRRDPAAGTRSMSSGKTNNNTSGGIAGRAAPHEPWRRVGRRPSRRCALRRVHGICRLRPGAQCGYALAASVRTVTPHRRMAKLPPTVCADARASGENACTRSSLRRRHCRIRRRSNTSRRPPRPAMTASGCGCIARPACRSIRSSEMRGSSQKCASGSRMPGSRCSTSTASISSPAPTCRASRPRWSSARRSAPNTRP